MSAFQQSPPTPPAGEVWHALRWALDHDLPALLAHRSLSHRGDAWRRRADVDLVARWRHATAPRTGVALRRAGGDAPGPGDCAP